MQRSNQLFDLGFGIVRILIWDCGPPWRDYFFYEHLFEHRPRGSQKNLIPRTEGVVSERYKYVRYLDQEPPYEQLFDLRSDPHETNNLVGHTDYDGTLKAFRIRWQQLRHRCR